MFKGEYSPPAWICDLDAQSPPMQEVKIDGKDFIFGTMCKVNECGNDKVICLFTADHKKCWSLEITVPYGLGADGAQHPKRYASLRYYGAPDVPTKKYLMFQLSKDPSWK
jgi:hypothetical protein